MGGSGRTSAFGGAGGLGSGTPASPASPTTRRETGASARNGLGGPHEVKTRLLTSSIDTNDWVFRIRFLMTILLSVASVVGPLGGGCSRALQGRFSLANLMRAFLM